MINNKSSFFSGRNTTLYISFTFIALTVFLLPSCTVTKQSQYFETLQKKDTTLKNVVTNDFESKIVAGDRLAITASSLSPLEDALFNNGAGASTTAAAATGASSLGGYTVQADGTIFLHRLGKTKVAGLSRRELATDIEQKLLPYLKEPIVQVSYLNHKITIIGEVGKPQILQMPEEQISLIDALVLSGDPLPQAQKSSITIIRDNGNTKQVKHVNLEDNSIFSSPWYYVKPNDIILISSDATKYAKEEKRRQLQTSISLIASVTSLLIIILTQTKVIK